MNHLNRKSPLAVIALACSLAACSMTGGYNSPEYRLPNGSTVELTKTLQFPFRSARTYIQGGKSLRWSDINRFEPYCSFGLNRNRNGEPLVSEIGPALFKTGEFHIGVRAALDGGGLHLASGAGGTGTGGGVSSPGGNGGPPWPYSYYTKIELYSDEAPQVDDLTCSYDGGPIDRNLTLEEISLTLGDLVRIY